MNDETLSKLERLAKLKEQGAITDSEFDQQKAQLMVGGTPPPVPMQPAQVEKKEDKKTFKGKGLVWVGLILFLLFVVALFNKTKENQYSADSNASTEEPAAEMPPYRSLTDAYTILENNKIGAGPYTNLVAIVGDSIDGPDLLVLASIIKRKECVDIECNTIDVWNSENAYYLYKNKSDSPKWRKKHWKTVCEGNVANYVVSVGELLLYPLIDEEYRRWGGKKKRPNISSYNL